MTDKKHHTLNYVEFSSNELEKTQGFLNQAFGWEYIDYGPDYKDVQGAGIGAGIERAPLRPPLAVVHSTDLEASFEAVKKAGAEITKEIFSFPGGRRFQFIEPGGNEMAVWSES